MCSGACKRRLLSLLIEAVESVSYRSEELWDRVHTPDYINYVLLYVYSDSGDMVYIILCSSYL